MEKKSLRESSSNINSIENKLKEVAITLEFRGKLNSGLQIQDKSLHF